MRTPIWSGLVLCALLGCAGPMSSASATSKVLRMTPTPAPGDELIIRSLELQGDTLVAQVRHSGGCREHVYELLWDGVFQTLAAGDTQAELVLAHDANGDSCEALLSRTATFDLGPLKRRWREQNKGEHGTIELRFAGSQSAVRYAF
ncbi:hypothetical protein [Vitiosangium sp. GDMCC 1.1324]|uniref:hypothetical protein n=1 Tax=Vitiosangium sp. (strain GDMCC 1.1324) TaxID=2138576 RepID=UPI000D33FE20|nr:hypothetical protein [Vitiosangium sp. GDMCC 1.1324]PTL82203.1 hypothetical protein DAT35_20660 [Vitiosangium sp. GDMCC 1.1324]